MAACHSMPQKASGELVMLKLQMTKLNKFASVTETDQSFDCTKATGSMVFERPRVIVAMLLK